MTVPVITAAFSITYFAITIWLVRRVKLDVRSICYASVICALTVSSNMALLAETALHGKTREAASNAAATPVNNRFIRITRR